MKTDMTPEELAELLDVADVVEIVESGEVAWTPGNLYYLACCDCGLVHEIKVSHVGDGNVRVSFTRDGDRTDKLRSTRGCADPLYARGYDTGVMQARAADAEKMVMFGKLAVRPSTVDSVASADHGRACTPASELSLKSSTRYRVRGSVAEVLEKLGIEVTK